MEDYSVILANDLVVKSSNFGCISSLSFNKSGKVSSFKYGGLTYIALYEFKSNAFMDYCEEENFKKFQLLELEKEKGKYDGVSKKLWENYVFKSYDNLVSAQNGDTIYGVLRDSSGLCYNYHTWVYSSPYLGPINPQLAPNHLPQGQQCDTFPQGSVAKSFFDTYKDQTFYDTNQSDIRLIGEIASLLQEAGEKTALAFQDFTLTGVDTINFNFATFQNGFPRGTFLEYKKGLELWLKMLKKYQSEITKLGHDEKLFIYIDVMYRHNMLTLLTPQQRINILKILVEKRPLMNWYWVNFSIGFVHKEDLALFILKSVNATDASVFLDLLISTNVIKAESKDHQGVVYNTTYITLYKLLFYRMDDYGGNDNFTAYVKELERLVLLKNGIPISPVPEYSVDQLKNLTKAQFIWREKGPKKGRVKYRIISNTDTKIKIEETIIVKTELTEIHNVNTLLVPVISGYDEIAVDIAKKDMELNHFDLISIHFYTDPSFIDLSSDQTYVGKNYLTFAGFVDYILEKEDTKIAEDVFNAALFTIALLVGFGELVAAIRTVNIARAVCGLGMVTSDSALYLSQDTSFRNYIINRYGVQEGNQILSNMTILATIASLGTNALAGSGILKAYSREQGLKLVGTAEAILKDSNALSHLTPNEVLALKESIKKVKNALYSLRNNEEAVNTIINTRANVFFNKFSDLKSGINTLSQADRILFYKNFSYILENELDVLRSVWLGSNNLAQLELINNSDIWLKYLRVRDFLKNGQYSEVSKLFNKPIGNSFLSNGLKFVAPVEDHIAIKILIISQDSSDILTIGNKLGIDVDIIQQAKEHYFIKEHFVRSDISNEFVIGRFGKDDFDIEEWTTFRDKPISEISQYQIDGFKKLIAHEYIESKLMEEGMNFRAYQTPNNFKPYDFGAHELAPTLSNGTYPEIGRLSNFNPPSINFNNFTKSDLDDVVNWYKNFYKL